MGKLVEEKKDEEGEKEIMRIAGWKRLMWRMGEVGVRVYRDPKGTSHISQSV